MSRLVNVAGQRFGRLTALDYVRANDGRGRWRCVCDCGAEVLANSDNLKKMKYGCRPCADRFASEHRTKDALGQTFGKLTAISKAPGKGRWLCRCECGEQHTAIGSHLRNGKTTECRKCALANRGIKRRRHSTGDMPKTFWDSVVRGANSREIDIVITAEEAYSVLEDQEWKCALSGVDIRFRTKGRENTASLDRINSDKGYVVGNVQWVHKVVNFMKRDLDQQTFIEWCERISSRDTTVSP